MVGTALNLINQGDALLYLINQGDALLCAAIINWWKLCLTHAMPYAVSTYGAVALRMAQEKPHPP